MSINVDKEYYIKKDSWFFMLPTISVGYYRKFLSISLYLIVCEISLNFDWE